MFLDASAIVAILNQEPQGAALEDHIDRSTDAIYYSPTVRFEAVVSLARAHAKPARRVARSKAETLVRAKAIVDIFFEEIGAREVDVTSEIGAMAIQASIKFGKAAGHAADLNFGDCFVYACAAVHREALLFIGDDFNKTDLKGERVEGLR